MADVRIRELERRAALGDVQAQAQLIRIRLNIGTLAGPNVFLAAILGSPAAEEVAVNMPGQLIRNIPGPTRYRPAGEWGSALHSSVGTRIPPRLQGALFEIRVLPVSLRILLALRAYELPLSVWEEARGKFDPQTWEAGMEGVLSAELDTGEFAVDYWQPGAAAVAGGEYLEGYEVRDDGEELSMAEHAFNEHAFDVVDLEPDPEEPLPHLEWGLAEAGSRLLNAVRAARRSKRAFDVHEFGVASSILGVLYHSSLAMVPWEVTGRPVFSELADDRAEARWGWDNAVLPHLQRVLIPELLA